MRPSFALNFTDDGITLLHRTAQGWVEVGSTPFESPALDAALKDILATAHGLEPSGVTTMLLIPQSQIRYFEFVAPGPDESSRRTQIATLLEGRTPYEVEELVFDWLDANDHVKVAVVARETLQEAEAFAAQYDFAPQAFATLPLAKDSHLRPPFFGPTSLNTAPAALLREDEAFRVIPQELAAIVDKSEDIPQDNPVGDNMEDLPAADPIDIARSNLAADSPTASVLDQDDPAPEVIAAAESPASQDPAPVEPEPEQPEPVEPEPEIQPEPEPEAPQPEPEVPAPIEEPAPTEVPTPTEVPAPIEVPVPAPEEPAPAPVEMPDETPVEMPLDLPEIAPATPIELPVEDAPLELPPARSFSEFAPPEPLSVNPVSLESPVTAAPKFRGPPTQIIAPPKAAPLEPAPLAIDDEAPMALDVPTGTPVEPNLRKPIINTANIPMAPMPDDVPAAPPSLALTAFASRRKALQESGAASRLTIHPRSDLTPPEEDLTTASAAPQIESPTASVEPEVSAPVIAASAMNDQPVAPSVVAERRTPVYGFDEPPLQRPTISAPSLGGLGGATRSAPAEAASASKALRNLGSLVGGPKLGSKLKRPDATPVVSAPVISTPKMVEPMLRAPKPEPKVEPSFDAIAEPTLSAPALQATPSLRATAREPLLASASNTQERGPQDRGGQAEMDAAAMKAAVVASVKANPVKIAPLAAAFELVPVAPAALRDTATKKEPVKPLHSAPARVTADARSPLTAAPDDLIKGLGMRGNIDPPRSKFLLPVLLGLLLLCLAVIAGWASYTSQTQAPAVETNAPLADPPAPAEGEAAPSPEQSTALEPATDDEMLADEQDPTELALEGAGSIAEEDDDLPLTVDPALARAAKMAAAAQAQGTAVIMQASLQTSQIPQAQPAVVTAAVTAHHTGPRDEVFVSGMEAPLDAVVETVAMAAPKALAEPEVAPLAPAAPQPFGTVYKFDDEGKILPTKQGTVTPDGVTLLDGRPKRLPPSRPDSLNAATADVVNAPAEEPASLVIDPAHGKKKPRLRPADLKVEKAAEASGAPDLPEADQRYAGMKPKSRPPTIAAAAEESRRASEAASIATNAAVAAAISEATQSDVSPLAIAVSRTPEARPRSLATAAVITPPAAVASAQQGLASASTAAPAVKGKPAEQPQTNRSARVTSHDEDEADEEPEEVARAAPRIPVSANLAKQATYTKALNLSKLNLIGVYGTPSKRHALIRTSNGRYTKVKVGDKIDGGQVQSIGTNELRYVKGSKVMSLTMPKS